MEVILEMFWVWFNDPLVQSDIISPLIGVILGVILAGLNNPPMQGAPVSIDQTTLVFQQTIIVNQNRARSSDDGWLYIMMLFVIVAGITWSYSRYSYEILHYWVNGLFSCLTFILSAGVASALRGQFNTPEWRWYIFPPLVALFFSFYLFHLAKLGIIPGAREAAQRHGYIEFYIKVLKDEHRMWLLLQIFGVLLGVISVLTATFRSLHYLALMNQRTNGGLANLWRFVARYTMFSSRKWGIFILVLTACLSYIALSGAAYELWQHKGQ